MNIHPLTALLMGAIGGALAAYFSMRLRFKQQEQELLSTQAQLSAEKDKSVAIEKTEKQLKDTFVAVAADALNHNREALIQLAQQQFQTHHESAKGELDHRQKSVVETLKRFDSKLGEINKDHGELKGVLSGLRAETTNLVNALKDPQVKGHWGETQLRRVIEIAGMVKHCDFVEQKTIQTEGGALRPDVIVKLPNDLQIPVDSKVPLKHLLEVANAENEEDRNESLKQHSDLVRKHVQDLGSKEYWEHLGGSHDYVVMFMGDTAYSAAYQWDPSLWEYAAEKRVLITTPITLIALLQNASLWWQQERITKNAAQISDLGKLLYDRLCTFSGHFSNISTGLNKAVTSYNEVVASLDRRLFVTARKFQDLGVRPEKTLQGPPAIDTLPTPVSAPEFHEIVSEEEPSDD